MESLWLVLAKTDRNEFQRVDEVNNFKQMNIDGVIFFCIRSQEVLKIQISNDFIFN